jgi:hypothetical protein
MLPVLRPLRRWIRFLLGDAGYDSGPLHEQVRRDLEARLLSPQNPRRHKATPPPPDRTTVRGRALALLATPRGRALYRRRTIIEQVNGQLKDVLGISDIPYDVRGEAAVERLVGARLILYNTALLKNVLDRQPHIRHVKALVA